ncbi:MAG: hypothetical protein RLN75_08680, partial [Longimicrobiales bacterium]
GEPDGGCRRASCRRAARARWLADEGDHDRSRREQGVALLRARGVDPDVGSWTVVPSNLARPVALDPTAVADFRRHLRRVLDDLVSGGPGRSAPDSDAADVAGEPPPEETDAVARACATCRGWCCRRGGSHAFLDVRSVDRVWRGRPGASPTALEALYVEHLGDTHLDGGCVFQGESGCRLPRSLRSDTCNSWLCPDLGRQRERWRDGGEEPSATRFVAVDAPARRKKS